MDYNSMEEANYHNHVLPRLESSLSIEASLSIDRLLVVLPPSRLEFGSSWPDQIGGALPHSLADPENPMSVQSSVMAPKKGIDRAAV